MHNQLSKTQKDVNQRLAEIEMQIHEEEFSFDGNPSPKSSEEEEENNRESFIWTKAPQNLLHITEQSIAQIFRQKF